MLPFIQLFPAQAYKECEGLQNSVENFRGGLVTGAIHTFLLGLMGKVNGDYILKGLPAIEFYQHSNVLKVQMEIKDVGRNNC